MWVWVCVCACVYVIACVPSCWTAQYADMLIPTTHNNSCTEGLIGASLSEPHTSMTALLDVCVCMFVRGHIPKI